MNRILILFFIFLISNISYANIVEDDFVKETLQDIKSPYVHDKYDYTSTECIPIKLSIIEPIKSEKDVYEGQILKFQSVGNVFHNDKIILKSREIVSAKVITKITPGMNGIPASIILGDFEIKNIKKSQLSDVYEISGQDRSIFVFPLKWALTPIPPTGSLTNFIMGGHAKIKRKKHITIYYYPNWI